MIEISNKEVTIWGFTGEPYGSLIDTIQEDGEKRITCKHTAAFLSSPKTTVPRKVSIYNTGLHVSSIPTDYEF